MVIVGCGHVEKAYKRNCDCLVGKRIHSAEEAKIVAADCLKRLGVTNYVFDSAGVTLTDSTYGVVFWKTGEVLPPTDMLIVNISDGCTTLFPQK